MPNTIDADDKLAMALKTISDVVLQVRMNEFVVEKAKTSAQPSNVVAHKRKRSQGHLTPKTIWEDTYTKDWGKYPLRVLVCNTCDREISTLNQFKQHYRVVHLGRCYNCPKCALKTKTLDAYVHHIPSCHNDPDIMPLIAYKSSP